MRLSLCVAMLAVPFVAAVATRGAQAEDPVNCQPGVRVAAGVRFPYRELKDRCEGMYAQPTSAQTIHVLAMVASPADASAPDDNLKLSWLPPDGARNDARVYLSAISLKDRTYYRMDANRPVAIHDYDWPIANVREARLDPADFGIFVTTPQRLAHTRNVDVYLPVQVGPKRAPAGSCYQIVLVSDAALSHLDWSVAPIERDGFRGTTEIGPQAAPIPRDLNAPIKIDIPCPRNRGLYEVTLEPTPRGGAQSALVPPTIVFSNAR